MRFRARVTMLAIAVVAVAAYGCGKQQGSGTPAPATAKDGSSAPVPATARDSGTTATVSGTVRIDGSSTVFLLSEAVAEEFGKLHRDARVPVGSSGTGGGFKKFAAGELDISGASRPIKESEITATTAKGIQFVELPVAYDGLSVVVSAKNDFVKNLTRAELKRIWEPDSKVKTWQDVRPEWPARPIKLYGPGTDSGTFDYFTEVINGKAQASRRDFTPSEDDNVLVVGVAGDTNSLGFFGYAYYHENQDKLRAVAIDDGKGPVAPSPATILDGSYSPLSRPIFIYVSVAAAQRSEVGAFVEFYMKNAAKLAKEVGYVALPDVCYDLALKRFKDRTAGTMYAAPGASTTPVEALLRGAAGKK